MWVCVFIPHTCFASRRHSSPLKSAKSCSTKMPPHFSPPPFCCFFIISLTFLPPPLFGHQRRLFQWLPSNQMSLRENWLAETPPCAGDSVRMGIEESADQGIELALLSGKLRASLGAGIGDGEGKISAVLCALFSPTWWLAFGLGPLFKKKKIP